jgi:hypothetical protein
MIDPRALARLYGFIVGAGLMLEGGLLLVLAGLPNVALPFATGDVRHNALHVVWGAVMLALLRTRPRIPTVLIFGVFYTGLGLAGVLVDRPFGLVLGPAENAFHFMVGPLAVALGVWAELQSAPSASSESNAASVSSAPAVSSTGDSAAPR